MSSISPEDHLSKWKVPHDSQLPLTHVMMKGGPCSRLHVPVSDRLKFVTLVSRSPQLCIAEMHSSKSDDPSKTYIKLFFDVDIDDPERNEEKRARVDMRPRPSGPNGSGLGASQAERKTSSGMTWKKAHQLVSYVHRQVIEMFSTSCSVCRSMDTDDYAWLYEGMGYRCSICRHQGDYKCVVLGARVPGQKVGVHLIYPCLVVTLKECERIASLISEKMKWQIPAFADCAVMDGSPYRPGGSLRMPFMDKPHTPTGSKVYNPVSVLDYRGFSNTDEVERLCQDPIYTLRLCSIRTDQLPHRSRDYIYSQSFWTVPIRWAEEFRRVEEAKRLEEMRRLTGVSGEKVPIPDDLRQALSAIDLFQDMKMTSYKRIGLDALAVYTTCKQCPNVKKTPQNPLGEHHSRTLWISVTPSECTLRCFSRKESTADLKLRVQGSCKDFRLPMTSKGPQLPLEIALKYFGSKIAAAHYQSS